MADERGGGGFSRSGDAGQEWHLTERSFDAAGQKRH